MRKTKTFCSYCGSTKLEVGVAFCDRCEQPTEWASYDERVQWELDRWHQTRANGTTMTEAPPKQRRSFLDRLRRDTDQRAQTPAAERDAEVAPRVHRTREPRPIEAPSPGTRAPVRPAAPATIDLDRVSQPASPDAERIAAILAKLASYATDAPPAPNGNGHAQDPIGELARAKGEIGRLQQRLDDIEQRLKPQR